MTVEVIAIVMVVESNDSGGGSNGRDDPGSSFLIWCMCV